MRVLPLTPADVPAYRRLMLHGYEHAADAFTSTAQERAEESADWWLKRVCATDRMCVGFGAFHDDALIGAVAVEFSQKPKTRHKASLIGMYVLASHRGAGAGAALLQAAIDYASARPGIAVLQLTVTEGNQSATSLYTKAGFETFGLEPMAIRTPSGYLAKRHMWLALHGSDPAQD